MGKINTDNYPNRPFASYQDDDMFILQDNGGETYTTNVGDIKNLADSRIKLEGVQVNGTDLPISGKKVNVDISGKTDLKVIAFPFHDPEPGEPSMGFYKGAYVTYNGKLYEFTQEHQGAWNPSHVREIDVDEMYVRAGNGGYDTGRYSTTEGHSTRAEGEASHAEGLETIANSDNQHVEGKYNVADTDDEYALIVGNGTADNARSNALTLDWDGNLEVSGDVEDGNGEKISDKTDKVTNATSGHLAGLDSNGNLTDSGVSPTEEVTVEGNPVTFDSPFEQDAKSVVVSVKPIQDLHGLPFPYVGGAYKNKLPLVLADIKAANTDGTWSGNVYTHNSVTFTVLTDSDDNVTGIKVNGTTSNYSRLELATISNASGKVLNGCPSGGSSSGYKIRVANTSDVGVGEDIGSGYTIPSDETYKISINVGTGTTVSNQMFYPMIRLATESDATFAPYSNECPISGIDEVEIGVSGKNLCEKTFRGFINTYNSINIDNDSESAVFYAHAGQTYCLSSSVTAERNSIGLVSTDNIVSGMPVLDTDSADNNVWTATWTGWTVWYAVPRVSADFEATCQIELGSIPTAYEPYTGHTTTIPLPSTLYGGTVDVTEGSTDSRYGYIASYNGETLPGAWISDRDVYTGSNSPTTGAEVCYELATPTTISLTPTDVELLEGTNVVSTNGEKVAVTYGRSLWQDIDELKTDTEGKLNKSDVADVEGDTASKAYSVNDFMLRADGFYKVTAPIASGASITASNTTKTTIGAVLTALLNS